MKITFILFDYNYSGEKNYLGHYHFSIAYLSSFLKQNGHQTSLIHIINKSQESGLLSALSHEKPDLVGFTATTNTFPYVRKWAPIIKENNPDIPIICGGPHATLDPEDVLSSSGIDMVCIGEGERPLKILMDKMSRDSSIYDTKSIWFKSGSQDIIKNPIDELITDLDTIPFSDRDIFVCETISMNNSGICNIFASRGCPYGCTYCCNYAIKQVYPNKNCYVRYRSVNNVIEELVVLKKRYPKIKIIQFHDDILVLNRNWFREFAEKYKKEISIPFTSNFRPNLVSEEVISLLRKAGCYKIHIGIESGDQYIREEILGRNITDRQLEKAVSLSKKYGLQVFSYNMIGIPFETPKRILDTIKINGRLRTERIAYTILYPYKHTRIYEICKKENLMTDKVLDSYKNDTTLNLPNIPPDYFLMIKNHFKIFVRFYTLLYWLPKPLNTYLVKLTDTILLSKYCPKILNFIYPVSRSCLYILSTLKPFAEIMLKSYKNYRFKQVKDLV